MSGRSTGWHSEAYILGIVAIGLALLGDYATQWELPGTVEVAGRLGQFVLGALAVRATRRRELAKRDAEAAAGGSAGA